MERNEALMAGTAGRSVVAMRRAGVVLILAGLVVAGCGVAQHPSGSGSSAGAGDGASLSAKRAECGAGTRTAGVSLPFVSARRAGAGWSTPAALVRPGTAVGSLGVSATPTGSLLAGWVQGPPPKISAGGALASPGESTATARRAKAGTQKVMIATGSLTAGFQKSVPLSVAPSGSLTNLEITLSAPAVGYVAWDQGATGLHLTVVCSGKVAVSGRLLVRDATAIALFPLLDGRAALVFDQYGHGTPYLDYAVLSPAGTIGRIARIAHPGTQDTAATELSVNARGELIAAWVHDDLASPPGSSPSSPGFLPARLVVAVCRPALQCTNPQAVPLGKIRPACINPAVAISPSGATIVIAAADDWAVGCNDPLRIRASVTPGGGTSLHPMRLIQTQGDFPMAEPVGNTGAVIAFNPGLASSDSLASAFLSTTGSAPVRAQMLDNGGWMNSGGPSLAPANNGWYLITWKHEILASSVRAALGHNNQVESASTAVSTPTNDYVGAVSGDGDAIIIYSGSTNNGTWPYSTGLYVTIHHH